MSSVSDEVFNCNFICSFFTPAIIYNTGVKKAICAAWLGHCLFVACNFYPHWATLIPGAIIMGFLNCPLWTSLEIYMTALARVHMADKKGQTTFHASFSRLNGVFFCIFMGSQLSGNLISSTILFQSDYDQAGEVLQVQADLLEPGGEAAEVGASQCGINFCSSAGQRKKLIVPPDQHVVYALMAVFLACEVIGLMVTAVWLPDLEQPRWRGRDVWRKLTSHLESLTNPKLWLLVPFLMSRMMNLALEVGTFTEAYISCTLGIRMVGFIMATWGLATVISAPCLGWLARYTGRQVLCVSALAFDAIIFLVLTLWEPRVDELNTFFGLAILMGLVEGIWVVQVNGKEWMSL
nr:hypothetical protein BaRGS_014763 [Batillaria attramentaria]